MCLRQAWQRGGHLCAVTAVGVGRLATVERAHVLEREGGSAASEPWGGVVGEARVPFTCYPCAQIYCPKH